MPLEMPQGGMAQGSSLLSDVNCPPPTLSGPLCPLERKGWCRTSVLRLEACQSRGKQVKMQMPRPTGESLV